MQCYKGRICWFRYETKRYWKLLTTTENNERWRPPVEPEITILKNSKMKHVLICKRFMIPQR